MPRKPCYWTRKLELDLVEFVKQREFIWRSVGNTNHHIQQKYKAYAEFASKLGHGFTARSVRDRWVNIRSTFHHNLRKVDKSRETAQSPSDVYVPCWPLWRPLQFLYEVSRKDGGTSENHSFIEGDTTYNSDLGNSVLKSEDNELNKVKALKEESQTIENFMDSDEIENLLLRPSRKATKLQTIKKGVRRKRSNDDTCLKVVDDLVLAMEPLITQQCESRNKYYFFGKHVVERLNCMRDADAACASRDIILLLDKSTRNLT